MTWLVAHMWIALAGAAGIALLLGWAVRGMLLLGKLRRAEVDRDVTRVELGEARDEIERLFASQRKLLTGQAGMVPAEAMQASHEAGPELEQRLVETLALLSEARAELETLKTATPVPAPSPEPELAVLPAMGSVMAVPSRELEERITALEAELEDARHALSAAEPDAKLVWKVSYLTQRVKALEDEVASQPAVSRPVVLQAEAAPSADTPVAALVEAPVEPAVDQASMEEELASLRWRNRYLEGRIAYFEGDAASVAEEIAAEEETGDTYEEEDGAEYPEGDEEDDERGSLEGRDAEFDLDAELEAIADETEIEDLEELEAFGDEAEGALDDDVAQYEAEADDGPDDEPVRSAADAILGQLEEEDALADAAEDNEAAFGEAEPEDEMEDSAAEDEEQIVPARPLALERPVEGAPVDLTLIGGIGPRIQEVLNSLGIFHYDQIAEWTPENIVWIDDYLNFNGRIKREGWVEQAAILVGESVDS